MHRYLTIIALAGVLAACAGQGDGTTDRSPATTTSPAAASSPDATTDPAATASPGDTASTSGTAGGVSAECDEAFADLEAMQVDSITELGDLRDEVEPTIEACESVDEWITGAQDVIDEEINPNTAALLLRMNCGHPSLSGTSICRELASS